MPFGYSGNILHIDLSSKKHWIEHPPETFYRTYQGGRALALYYMLKEMKPHTDPLSPDNLLIFAPWYPNRHPCSSYAPLHCLC